MTEKRFNYLFKNMKAIKQIDFKESQYIKEEHTKKQIYLHHTAGGANPIATFKYWESTSERVATCVTIGGKADKSNAWIDGEIVQGFSSKFWAYHLGLQTSTFKKLNVPYQSLDKISIGVEICNFGFVNYKDGKFLTYVNSVIPKEDVIELDHAFRGHKFFHAYTDAQIESVKELLLLWNQKYNIPLKYNEDIWDVCPRALKGESGVYTHNSVRFDKIDITPQPKMIAMLKSL
jgi:N-acetyl-anhydromuramyl-L-alanine amidase AmpD